VVLRPRSNQRFKHQRIGNITLFKHLWLYFEWFQPLGIFCHVQAFNTIILCHGQLLHKDSRTDHIWNKYIFKIFMSAFILYICDGGTVSHSYDENAKAKCEHQKEKTTARTSCERWCQCSAIQGHNTRFSDWFKQKFFCSG
jgi:hypothetical protein